MIILLVSLVGIWALWSADNQPESHRSDFSQSAQETPEAVQSAASGASTGSPANSRLSGKSATLTKREPAKPQPASQWAKPGEKPMYGLPLEIWIDAPPVPERISRPARPIRP